MISFQGEIRRRASAMPALGIAGLLALSGCGRVEEEEMRRLLGQWVSLGDTVSFRAGADCAAGVFRLASSEIGSAMPVLRDPARVAAMLGVHGRVALDDPSLAPDRAMIRIANLDRSLGMRMRRAGLDGRACMDDVTESAFRHALTAHRAVLAYDAGLGAVVLIDPAHALLVVTMGERA